ncbi:MAG: PIN domain-containing protein [Deltaproteobacteria bacterium]|nr:PIN domain-containing protein [Deltaproteobacteria bacterium]MBW1910367.1 PIN domain-containing protein [Deltaproteobacteria bacterium]MBW2034461.1 PIN domain-containing protein [Deltaproteobacteria bacterium]
MKTVFADSHYWIAIVNPDDPWAKAAKAARSDLGEVFIVTTDEVLTEFLAALSRGEHMRKQAAKMVRAILENPNVKVIPQTRESFLKGLIFYENRSDKEYSLTDCISMNVMSAESLVEALTNDHHFEQEGFTFLIKK